MREVVMTKDGSHTIAIPEKGVTYHSVHGAVQESMHVFIEAGLGALLTSVNKQDLSVFEMGFGTGLNAFLTVLVAQEQHVSIFYTSVEAFPLSAKEASFLNYADVLGAGDLFQRLHQCGWNEEVTLNEFFTIEKVQTELTAFSPSRQYDLVYYDAFAPSAQPELWTKAVFEKLYEMMHGNGVLVTYCSKGDVRRALLAAGFAVEKIPGPPGKREMLRARKP
ncbi:MAG TPA: tRNA (5-methylaminomethyl-2-thiouridine)(34)-methyltransferase MnmD [Flavisolibacter sp.]|jgi:tRNA U34 5-methylaminomethyl-2-thiouridine-forming methyltransferase MnmC|nr:tRNA (5-methylaminomethyl-2-thiouridine)(34)-methyltransferase MnmD [Flavisolibacter sp.]